MTPADPSPVPIDVATYFALADRGALAPEDRVELLEGVVVAMSPQSPLHASVVTAVAEALRAAVGARARAHVRVQLPLLAGRSSVPEPDCALVSGDPHEYAAAHPSSALLVVEVAESTLAQDRITKAAIYAAAGVGEYWIVNLRDGSIEVHRAPNAARGLYTERCTFGRGERIELSAVPAAVVAVDEVLPPAEDAGGD